MAPTDGLRVDVLIIGGGIAGMTVAATVAERGFSVIVVERAEHIGGSAVLSESMVWTAPSVEVFLQQDPEGDVKKFSILLNELPAAFEWLERSGVYVGPVLNDIFSYGTGRQIDIAAYMAFCRGRVEGARGWVFTTTEVTSLRMECGKVAGAKIRHAVTGESAAIRARAVVIATGGFQADPASREEWLFPGAGSMLLRSNPCSRGDGIRLGIEVGAVLTPPTSGFYGHLLPYPLVNVEPEQFFPLAQIYSDHCVLVDKQGVRFTDESLGDHMSAASLARHGGQALLIFDERVRVSYAVPPLLPGMVPIDKLAVAARHGAHQVSADTLGQLAAASTTWGYDGNAIEQSVSAFNTALAASRLPDFARSRLRHPLVDPPYFALEVQPAITFTYRGLATDCDGRVLARREVLVPGLYAAGIDAGGLNFSGYAGGLVRGLVLGRRTGRAVAESEAANHT